MTLSSPQVNHKRPLKANCVYGDAALCELLPYIREIAAYYDCEALSAGYIRNIVIYCRMAAETKLYFGVTSSQAIGLSGSADLAKAHHTALC